MSRSTSFNHYLRCSPHTTHIMLTLRLPPHHHAARHPHTAAATRSHAALTPLSQSPHAAFAPLPRRSHATPALLQRSPHVVTQHVTAATLPQLRSNLALTQLHAALTPLSRLLNASFTLPAHHSHTATTPTKRSSHARIGKVGEKWGEGGGGDGEKCKTLEKISTIIYIACVITD